MLLFRYLVKQNKQFVWNENLEKLFQQSKTDLCESSKKGRYHFWHQQSNLPSLRLEQRRYGLPAITEILHMPQKHFFTKDVHPSDNIDDVMELATIQAIMNSGNNNTAMSSKDIGASGRNDQSYMTLIKSNNQGLTSKSSLSEPEICDFWEVQHRLREAW